MDVSSAHVQGKNKKSSQNHPSHDSHQSREEIARNVRTLKSLVNEISTYIFKIKGMLESSGSKLDNKEKRSIEEEDLDGLIKCQKLGYDMWKQTIPSMGMSSEGIRQKLGLLIFRGI